MAKPRFHTIDTEGFEDGNVPVWNEDTRKFDPGTGGGGGGTSDHGALSGLGDDDHTQYHNDSRGDTRYYTQAQVNTALAAKAPLASPTFTGTPAVPTAADGTNTTQAASTAFVQAALALLKNGVASAFDTLAEIATELGLKAPLASPTLTGTPTAPHPAADDDSTQIATTGWVQDEIAGLGGGGGVTDHGALTGLGDDDHAQYHNDSRGDARYYTQTQLDTSLAAKQPLDSDLTAIAALAPSNDDIIQRKSGSWINRTIAQLKADFGLVKADVGLSNVDNTADSAKPVSTAQQTALDAKADLVGGFVPSAQLPSFVDDVIEAANFAALPGTGTTGKIYVTLDTNVTYRWSGSAYVEISASLALGSTSSTAHRGDHGATAYTHSQATGNPHGTTPSDINGTVDDTLATPASTGTLTQLLSWIVGRLKAITGKSSWLTAPAITLESLSAHKDRHKSGGGDAFTSSDVLDATVKNIQTTTGPTTLVVGAIADGQYLKRSGTGIVGDTPAGGSSASYAAICDEKTAGTAGGTFTFGAWRTRDLNTEIYDPDSIVSIASNQFTLAAGTYLIEWSAPAQQVNNHKTRLQNITDGSTAGLGSTEYALNTIGMITRSIGQARVVIAGSKAFEIQHQCISTGTTTGFGTAASFSQVERYTFVEITKLA